MGYHKYPAVGTTNCDGLFARLARYDSLLEVGVGRRGGLAGDLAAAGKRVVATDVHDRDVPDGVRFVRDDVVIQSERTHPETYYHVDAIYARNLPSELQRPARDVARRVDADFLFTTLGFEQPAIPVRREPVGEGTVFVTDSNVRTGR